MAKRNKFVNRKQKRQDEAKARAEERSKRSMADQIKLLTQRRGASMKEMARLVGK